MKRLMPAAAVAAAALTACSDLATSSIVCPAQPAPSVVVRVLDGAGASRVEQQTTGSWATGALSDSLRHAGGSGDRYLAAYGPAGIYTVRVQRPGYAPWERGGIVVPDGSCGPATQELTATLLPG